MKRVRSTKRESSRWHVDPEKCVGCGDCIIICPVGALKVEKGVAVMVDEKSCCGAECRVCEYHCWKFAISAY